MSKISNSDGSMSRGKDLTRDDIRVLQDVFQRYPATQAVYVFGSILITPNTDSDYETT
jgi:hypothetical protein